jgi:hypothetical protein
MGFGIVSTDRSISAASGDPVRYRSGFFSPSSCDETPPPWEDADAGSLRPLAWDFRRFRFSRNARFSRSCLESLPPAGRFAAVGSCPGPLFSSSVIVDLFDAQPRMIGAWTDGRTIRIGTLPRQCLERWHRFVASGDPRCGRLCCRSISYSTRASCNLRFPDGLPCAGLGLVARIGPPCRADLADSTGPGTLP